MSMIVHNTICQQWYLMFFLLMHLAVQRLCTYIFVFVWTLTAHNHLSSSLAQTIQSWSETFKEISRRWHSRILLQDICYHSHDGYYSWFGCFYSRFLYISSKTPILVSWHLHNWSNTLKTNRKTHRHRPHPPNPNRRNNRRKLKSKKINERSEKISLLATHY